MYNLHMWNDITVYTLTREFTINDYLYKYWIKFAKHLEISTDALQYQLTFSFYLYAKSPHKNWYLSIGMCKNSKFLNRLHVSQRAKHSKIDLLDFLSCHYQQYGYFKHASFPTLFFYIQIHFNDERTGCMCKRCLKIFNMNLLHFPSIVFR